MSNTEMDKLISALAVDLAPVQRLRPPAVRLAVWVFFALPISLLLGALVESQNIQLAADRLQDPRMLVELIAILATALSAGYAALCCVQPGRSRFAWTLPIVPFLTWLALIGESCWTLWQNVGGQISFAPHWVCVPAVISTGAVPTVLIVMMIRRGAVLNAPLTVMLTTLAASALGAVGLRLFHQPDAVALVFMWQLIATFMFFVISGLAAAYMQNRAA